MWTAQAIEPGGTVLIWITHPGLLQLLDSLSGMAEMDGGGVFDDKAYSTQVKPAAVSFDCCLKKITTESE